MQDDIEDFKKSILGIGGVTVKNEAVWPESWTLKLVLETDFSLEDAQALVALVSEHTQLLFYDGDYPRISDPGVYCFLQRSGADLYVKSGNHGWSNPWLRVEEPDAVRWLVLCKDDNNDDSGCYENSVLSLRAQRDHRVVRGDLPERHESRQKFAAWLQDRLTKPE